MKEIWIIGAGRFGLIAAERLAASHREAHFVLVDPDRDNLLKGKGADRTLELADGVSFLNQRLHRGVGPDWIIPALPIHLAAEWCLVKTGPERLRRVDIPAEVDALVPNPARDSSGNIYVSHAAFLCPDDCDEPSDICSVTQKQRSRDMFELLGGIDVPRYRSLVIRSYQLGPGIGGYRPRQLYHLLEQIQHAGQAVLLSTACRCHGVMTGLRPSI